MQGNPVTANAINDAGEIIGAAAFPDAPYDAYVWRNGVATDLGHLEGDCYSEAWAINSSGQVVGISFPCDFSKFRAFLWKNGSLIDLNTLIPADSSLELAWALVINSRGEIGGIGVPPGVPSTENNVLGHAFVLIPSGRDEATEAQVVTEDHPLPANRSAFKQGGPTSREIMALVHARMGQNRGFGLWPGR
jgi:probable HAF family extracellular repeat protein